MFTHVSGEITFVGTIQKQSPTEDVSHQHNDVRIVVDSPKVNHVYKRNENILSSIDLQLGEGLLADSIRENPSNFDLCMVWDISEYSDSIEDTPLCTNIGNPGELPVFTPYSLVGGGQERKFKVWLRDVRQPNPIFVGQLAAVEVPYNIETKESCLVGVCLSGTLRTFASPTLRKRFIAAMDSLAGEHCRVELFAHITAAYIEEDWAVTSAVPWTNASWTDDGTGGSTLVSFEASAQQISETIQSLNQTLLERKDSRVKLVDVNIFQEAHHYATPNGCANNLPPAGSYAQLYKMAACYFNMVLPREQHLGRPYDWLIRARYDLAWLTPPPPLDVLRKDAISLSYAFWPISDQFAIIPRRLGESYFSAVDSFYNCDASARHKFWYIPGQVGTEILLMIHLLEGKVPYTFIEVNAPIARGSRTDRWCAIRQTLQIPCLILSVVGVVDWSSLACDRYYSSQPLDDKLPAPPSLLQTQCIQDFESISEEINMTETDSEKQAQLKAVEKLQREMRDGFEVPLKASDWLTSGSPEESVSIVLELTRGNYGEASMHNSVISAKPTKSDIHALMLATRDVFREWSGLSEKTPWYETPRRYPKSDRDLAVALQRVLKNAEYYIDTPVI